MIGTLLLLIGMAIGLHLPDIDLTLSFLVHRSIITHGFLLPLLLFWFAHKKESPIPRLFAMGISSSAAIHLCFDLFPGVWTGFALIHIPVYSRTSPAFSWLWIALSSIVCLYVAFSLIRNLFDVMMVISSLVIAFGFYATTEKNIFVFPLVALATATTIVLALPSNSAELLRKLRRRIVS